LALATTLLVSGCGDDGDEDPREPASDSAPPTGGATSPGPDTEADNTTLDDAALRTKVQAAASRVTSVHTTGTLRGASGEVRFDLRVDNASGDYAGTMTELGQTAQVMRVGPDLYLKADATYWAKVARVTDRNALAVVADKHVKLKAQDPRFKGITAASELGDINAAVSEWGTDVQRRPVTDVAGTPALVLADPDPQDGETLLYVPAKGEPYPVRMENRSPTDGGTIDWKEHNVPVTVTAPAAETVVNLPALTGETPAVG